MGLDTYLLSFYLTYLQYLLPLLTNSLTTRFRFEGEFSFDLVSSAPLPALDAIWPYIDRHSTIRMYVL